MDNWDNPWDWPDEPEDGIYSTSEWVFYNQETKSPWIDPFNPGVDTVDRYNPGDGLWTDYYGVDVIPFFYYF